MNYSARDIDALDIYCDGVLCGGLKRTSKGSAFTYTQEFLDLHEKPKGGIAFHLPYRDRSSATSGIWLHTFFEGLLPEGHRLDALVVRERTVRDDLFTAFVAAGPDTVGDVYALPRDDAHNPDRFTLDLDQIEASGFDEFERQFYGGTPMASIAGVQPKISAARLAAKVRDSKGFGPAILKLSPVKYPQLVENEKFFMDLAEKCAIDVPKTKIVTDGKGRVGLLVWRFDRVYDESERRWRRAHVEDACQFLDRYAGEKYRLKLRDIADAIMDYSEVGLVSLERLMKLYAYSYVIGNGDLHGKNISLLRKKWKGTTSLSPAYDLVSTLPYGDDRMAINLDAKDREFSRQDFIRFFGRYGLREKVVHLAIDRIGNEVSAAMRSLDDIGFEPKPTATLRRKIIERIEGLA